jgi:hypothetical protein
MRTHFPAEITMSSPFSSLAPTLSLSNTLSQLSSSYRISRRCEDMIEGMKMSIASKEKEQLRTTNLQMERRSQHEEMLPNIYSLE